MSKTSKASYQDGRFDKNVFLNGGECSKTMADNEIEHIAAEIAKSANAECDKVKNHLRVYINPFEKEEKYQKSFILSNNFLNQLKQRYDELQNKLDTDLEQCRIIIFFFF